MLLRRLGGLRVLLPCIAPLLCASAPGMAQGTGVLPVPAIRPMSGASVAFSWTTNAKLNTQIWYGPTGATQHAYNYLLVNAHAITLTGLQPGVTYQARTESSNYSNPDLWSPVFTFSTVAGPALLVSPASIALRVGQSQQFTASYSDGSPLDPLTWTVSGGGSVSSAGLFTASAAGTFILTVADAQGRTAVAALTLTLQGTGALPLPAINPLGPTSLSLIWTTSPRLNTQVWYGPAGGATLHAYNYLLVTAHAITLAGLQPGVTYQAQTESSNYSNPDLWSPVFSFSLAAPAASLQLAPAAAALTAGQSQQFVASYSDGSPVGALTWSVTGGGTVSSAGLFTATTPGSFTLTATDAQGRSASAALTIAAPVTLQLSPNPVTLFVTQSQQFAASYSDGSPVGALTWSITGGGTVSSAGLFTATTPGSFTLTATDAQGRSASATLTVAPPAGLSLVPQTVSLQAGQTQQFTGGYTDNIPASNLVWSVNNGGEVTTTGLFTAVTAGVFTVTATDAYSSTSTATVTVTAAPPPAGLTLAPANIVLLPGATVTFTAANASGAVTATWAATNGGAIDAASGVFTASAPGAYTVSATDASGDTGLTNVLVLSGQPPPPAASCPGCYFTSPQAAWLYAGPTPAWGIGHMLGSIPAGWSIPTISTNDIGFGVPIQLVTGADGSTAFNDYNYGPGWRHDSAFVPNPPGDVWTPSCGWLPPSTFGATSCYGAYDGKDFIIDDATGDFYDIDQLYVNASGQPINFGPYGYGAGVCGGPGETVCGIRGVKSGSLANSPVNLGGGTAAGIVSGAGDIVPGELDCDTCLNHAVQISIEPSLNNVVTCSAFATGKHGDGTSSLPHAILCEGGFLLWTGDWTKLDPATHSTAVIALARALQLYGGFITDQGGGGGDGFTFYSGYDHAPAMAGAADLLQDLVIFYGAATLQ